MARSNIPLDFPTPDFARIREESGIVTEQAMRSLYFSSLDTRRRLQLHGKQRHMDGGKRRPEAVSIYQNRPVPSGELLSGGHDHGVRNGESVPDSTPTGSFRNGKHLHRPSDNPRVSRYGRVHYNRRDG